MTVRRATAADLEPLGRLYETWRLQQPAYPRLDPEEKGRFLQAWAAQFCDPTGRHAAWVAYDGDRLVGFMDGDVCERTFGKPRQYLHGSSLWVDPADRHNGAATELIAACAEWLSAQGLTWLEMTEVPDTRGTWATRGWAQREVATSYWADLRDLLPLFAQRAWSAAA